MNRDYWNVTFLIYRHKADQYAHFDNFQIEVDPDEYLIDALERVWAFHDRSLTFTHTCHHSTCGACGLRVNGVEKLACITVIKDISANGAEIRVEPLRSFPVISDLVVDLGVLYRNMQKIGHRPVVSVLIEPFGFEINPCSDSTEYQRLSDCIECGLCISACPISAANPAYLGPAALAGVQQRGVKENQDLFDLVNSTIGVWRCHSAYECTGVCPSYVDPGRKIMLLRRAVLAEQLRKSFGVRSSFNREKKDER